MAWKWHIVSSLLVLLRWSFKGVLSQIDISPTSAFVDAGNELTFSCTRTSSTWFSFSYIINGAVCFLTFPTADPCHAGITSCSPLQSNSYSYSCDKIHFNLTIINVQRSMQNTSVIGSMGVPGSTLQTDEVIIQVNVPLTSVTVVPNGMLTLIEGATIQLTCSAVSIPPATLSWSLDGSPTATSSPPDINDDTVNSPYSYTARKQDNDKTITCIASYGSVQYTDVVTLNIQYLPNVEITPSIFDPYQVIENATNLQLMCSVNDTNPGVSSYSWYKDGSNLPEKTANYTISTVRRSDSGGYSCDATNPVGTSSMSTVVRLDVLFGVFLGNLDQRELNSGSKLNVTCTGESNPAITDGNIRWTKQNNNTFRQTGRNLIINNVDRADTGMYRCTANITMTPSIGPNVPKSASTILQVAVLYLPIVEIKPTQYNPYKVIENSSNLQLMCLVIESNPNVTSYRWYRNVNMTAIKTANLTIPAVRRSDAGDYSCHAENSVGISLKSSVVKVDVLFGITLDVLRPQQVIRGSKLDVPCTGQSNPPITDDNVRWTKQNNHTFTQTGRNLTIINVNKADTGIYICTVDITLIPSMGPNIQKSATLPLHVEILYLPTVEVKPSAYNPYKVIENTTDLQLSCSVIDSNPDVTSYRWYKENSIITTSTAIYTIPTVRKSDTGRYSCDATNMVGNSAKSTVVKLDVMYGVSIDVTEAEQKEEGELLVLNCTGQSNPAIRFENVLWTKEGNSTFSRTGYQLRINNVNRIDNGSFVCSINLSLTPSVGQEMFVSNAASTQVSVYYAPSVNIIPSRRNLTVTENFTNIILNCNVKDSYPDATNFTWCKNKERLLYHKSIFKISQVKKDDTGLYTCAAENIVGMSKQSPGVLLTVLYGVRLNISTTQIKVNETEQWSVIGTADGNPPPTFDWIYTHNDTAVQPFTISPKESSIIIRNANCQDSGRYSVIGHNGIGLDVSRSFDVQIICAPREVLNRRLINVFINDSALQLEAVFVAYPPPNISWSLMENTTELGSEYNISILESKFPYQTTSFLSKVNNKQLDRGKYYATAVNEHGSQTVTFNIANKDVVQDQASDSPSALIGGISGAAGSIFVAVVVMITFYLIRWRRSSGNKRETLVGTNKNTDEENDEYGLKDNPLYGDCKTVYSVNTKGDNKKGGRSKTNENDRDMVYENSADFLELDDSNIYSNSADNVNENKTRKHGKVNSPLKNKDGLIYADLDFDPSGKKFVIHGLENKTDYAFIDLNKTAEPLPSSDEDEVKMK